MLELDTPIDALEQELLAGEGLVARIRARQAQILARLETAQIATSDGARSMLEWTMAKLDITETTARRLLSLGDVSDRERIASPVAEGRISFDRAVATNQLARAGATDRTIEESFGHDLRGVRRISARHRRITKAEEHHAHRDRFLAIQQNLDGSSGRLWGQLPGPDLTIVEHALLERAARFPSSPPMSRSQQQADALVALAQDSAADGGSGSLPGSTVTVFVDAELAAATNGEAGGEVAAGPRVGPAFLGSLLCGASVQVVTTSDDKPVSASRASRTIPPALRHFVLHRDGGCVIDGCRSRYRLQPHHIRPYGEGGGHDPDNLATLCWFHHHVAIHRSGFRLDLHSPPQRRRLLPPVRSPALE